MRYQWAVQVKSIFSIGCGGQKLARKIYKKNFGLLRIWGWPLPVYMKPPESLSPFKESAAYKDKVIVMPVQDVFGLQMNEF